MAASRMTVRVRVAWWLRWYVAGLITVARATGTEPDPQKVERVVRRAVKVTDR